MQKKGQLFLIPSQLDQSNDRNYFPELNIQIAESLRFFIVENVRTARRFLRKMGYSIDFSEVVFFELNKHTQPDDIPEYLVPLEQGNDMGLISEAGLPCVADPGALVVEIAHQKGVRVTPLTGPSSIFLALMASGFNGQNFCFHGYLPIDKKLRVAKLKSLEAQAELHNQTQLWIETPYRNNQMFQSVLTTCKGRTRLCVAFDLTHPENETIVSMQVEMWKKKKLDFNKRPAVFLLAAGN